MSLTEPSGWDPFEAKWWPVIAASIRRPWPREAVWADLRWWAARERMGDGKRPGRPALEQRWGLTGHAARVAMLSEDVWGDPRTSTADRQPTDSGSPADRQPTRVRTNAIAEKPTADRQPIASESTADRPTRVGSQSTDTEHRHREHTAPAPAVADLFTPPSQPDAATGEATGDTAPPPGAAAPLPADVLAVVAVLAKLNQRSAERMTRGTNGGMVKAARKAIKALGLPTLLARLEYAAAAQDDEPMKFWRTTLGGKLAPLLTVDGPWVRGLDEAAADHAESAALDGPISDPGGASVTGHGGTPGERAWAEIQVLETWRDVSRSGASWSMEDRRWLSADETEHHRRCSLWRQAGGIAGWTEDQIGFRRRFVAAFDAAEGVTA